MDDERRPDEALNSTDIPSYDDFLEEIYMIHPDGDLAKTYERLIWYVENVKTCEDGTPLTYRLIMDQYAAHIKQWNYRYRKKEQDGYLSKEAEERRKTLYAFIGGRFYERVWIVSSSDSNRSPYLFGSFSIKYLKQMLIEFHKTYPYEQPS